MAAPFLTIGTRGSPLALAQTHQTRALIARAHGITEDEIAIQYRHGLFASWCATETLAP